MLQLKTPMRTEALIRSLFLVFLFVTNFPRTTGAQVDPQIEWKQTRIGNFTLIFDAEQHEIAKIYAARLQKMESELSPFWPVKPKLTTVVLNDRTDLTNGYATFLPYSLIMLYPVLPTSNDTIGEFEDWAWELLVHEYVHILSFEQRRGIPWGLSWIFGSIITPNSLLPRWVLEGAAVDAETRYSKAGRLRSHLQAGVLRGLAQAHLLNNYDYNQINETNIPSWPYGSRPYLFGSLIWSQLIHDTKDPKAPGDFHFRTGGRLPYLIQSQFEEQFANQNQSEIFEKTLKETRDEINRQKKDLFTVPITEAALVDPEATESLAPAISPDGLKLAYISKNKTLKRRIQILVRGKVDEPFGPQHRRKQFGKDEDLSSVGSTSPIPRDAPPGGNINRLDWSPDSSQLVYDQVHEKNRFREYMNLWIYDLKKGKPEQLMKAGRAREPAFSPDGKRIAFVRLDAGRTHLAVLDLETKNQQIVVPGQGQSRASLPVWISENEILYSERRSGTEKAFVKNLKSGDLRQVLEKFKDPLAFAIRRPSGKIQFTSTQNGVRNLYETDFSFKEVKPVSHVFTHLTNGVWDEGSSRYLATLVDSKGFQLVQFPVTEKQRLPPELPKTEPFWQSRYPTTNQTVQSSTSPQSDPQLDNLELQTEAYSPWGYLWPRYWLPFVSFGPDGFLGLVSTSGQDPLGKHSYSLSGIYDSAIKKGSFVGSYNNQSFYPILNVTYLDIYSRLADLSLISRNRAGQVSASWEIESVSPDWFVSLGYTGIQREKFGSASEQQGPFLGMAYSNTSKSGDQISPESGVTSQIVLSTKQEKVTARKNSSAEGSLIYYFSKWLPERHAVMSKFSGRYTDEPLRPDSLESSVSDLTTSVTLAGSYLVRGFPTGSFLGRNVANLNLEYRFPLGRMDWAPDRYPFYMHRWHGAVAFDGILFDGFAYNSKDKNNLFFERVEWGKGFGSAGLELRFEANVGYHLPITLAWGVYWPLSSSIRGSDPYWGLGLQL